MSIAIALPLALALAVNHWALPLAFDEDNH